MGYPPGRGPTVQRRRIAAASEAPFSLFEDSPTSTVTVAATSPAPPPAVATSNVSLADLLVAQKNQQDILEEVQLRLKASADSAQQELAKANILAAELRNL